MCSKSIPLIATLKAIIKASAQQFLVIGAGDRGEGVDFATPGKGEQGELGRFHGYGGGSDPPTKVMTAPRTHRGNR